MKKSVILIGAFATNFITIHHFVTSVTGKFSGIVMALR